MQNQKVIAAGHTLKMYLIKYTTILKKLSSNLKKTSH